VFLQENRRTARKKLALIATKVFTPLQAIQMLSFALWIATIPADGTELGRRLENAQSATLNLKSAHL